VIKRIADYDLIEEIGQGAYGKVYLSVKNNQKYAVKIVKIESNVEYEKNCKEIEILSRVNSAVTKAGTPEHHQLL
jgi:serine/threonine protein kinase